MIVRVGEGWWCEDNSKRTKEFFWPFFGKSQFLRLEFAVGFCYLFVGFKWISTVATSDYPGMPLEPEAVKNFVRDIWASFGDMIQWFKGCLKTKDVWSFWGTKQNHNEFLVRIEMFLKLNDSIRLQHIAWNFGSVKYAVVFPCKFLVPFE